MNERTPKICGWAVAAVCTTSCYTGIEDGTAAIAEDDEIDDAELTQRTVRDAVVGATLTMPATWATLPDPVLFEHGYGFMIYGPDEDDTETGPHDRTAIAHVTLRTDATALDLADVVADKLAQYEEFAPQSIEVALADGRRGVALTGLPGVLPYSAVFVEDGERLYEVGLWSEDEDAGLDDRGRTVLEGLAFFTPEVPVESLALARAETALYAAPPTDVQARNAVLAAERSATIASAASAGGVQSPAKIDDLRGPDATKSSCSFGQPDWMLWQLQWDNSNAFYSGDWYSLKNNPGWSAMSGNYGSWWGTNFHIWKCNANVLNQWYANDWPAYYWDNVYPAFEGTVEWAGWGTDGFASLGNFVVVNDGYGYRSLSAHLVSIPDWVQWGAWVELDSVIGYAGDTGEYYAYDDWAPHIHARVAWGESLTWNGQPYGGQSVWPNWLRCWTCNDPDDAANIGGWYTEFWYGRWMRH
jgi:murein DD-endopeptidase MepM/ murein hydrolase activator NlpD